MENFLTDPDNYGRITSFFYSFINNPMVFGYILLFAYSFGGGFLGLMIAGVLCYTGHMDLTTVLIIAFIANFLGDMMLFYMGRYNKKEVMVYIHKHKRKLALSHILMKKHGSWVVFLQKYVYGIKTLIPLAIGLTKYDMKKFAILNFFAAAIWTIVVGVGSFMAGEIISSSYKTIADKPWIAPILLLSIIGLIWWYLSAKTSKRGH